MHPERMMDLNFEFTLGGKRFEAVRYFEVTEESVAGQEALRRTDNGHLVCSGDDWQFVYKHRAELPKELEKYWLATARPSPGRQHNVTSLHYRDAAWRLGAGYWYVSWDSLDSPWGRNHLVLRHCVD